VAYEHFENIIVESKARSHHHSGTGQNAHSLSFRRFPKSRPSGTKISSRHKIGLHPSSSPQQKAFAAGGRYQGRLPKGFIEMFPPILPLL